MPFWIAAMLCGIAIAGLVTLCEVVVEALLLSLRAEKIVMIVPLRRGEGQTTLRRALGWLQGRQGVFPGCAAAVNLGLTPQEAEACRRCCARCGVEFLRQEELSQFIAKTVGKDYTDTGI